MILKMSNFTPFDHVGTHKMLQKCSKWLWIHRVATVSRWEGYTLVLSYKYFT